VTPAERKSLKARAHSLEPLVIIGGKGLTDAVVAEVAAALKAHELIKVRAPGLERAERSQVFEKIASQTQSELVQEIGKVAVLYKKWDTDPAA
jgi:RNA-binding protein